MPNKTDGDYYDMMLDSYLQDNRERALEKEIEQLKHTHEQNLQKLETALARTRQIAASESWAIHLRRANAAENRMITRMEEEARQQGINEDEMPDGEEFDESIQPLSPEFREEIEKAKVKVGIGGLPVAPQDHKNQQYINNVVEHPPHYQDVIPGVQYYQVLLQMVKGMDPQEAALKAHILKYMTRTGRKAESPMHIDIRKGIWYAERLMELGPKGKAPPTTEMAFKLHDGNTLVKYGPNEVSALLAERFEGDLELRDIMETVFDSLFLKGNIDSHRLLVSMKIALQLTEK